MSGPTAARLAAIAAAALLASACSIFSRTPAEEIAWDYWRKCEGRFPTASLQRIDREGTISFSASGASDRAAVDECLRRAKAELGPAEPAAAEPAPAPPAEQAPPSATSAPSDTTPAAPERARVSPPVWKPGDEWTFGWTSPEGRGTFVWAVARVEAVDGIDFYVLRSGNRETYYRARDLAVAIDKLDGVIEGRNLPPVALYVWPLEPGKAWEQTYIRERRAERQTAEVSLACRTSDVEESVNVPAGTFAAWVITCRNRRTNAPSFTLWYSPQVRFIVRDKTYMPTGVRERELIRFRAR